MLRLMAWLGEVDPRLEGTDCKAGEYLGAGIVDCRKRSGMAGIHG